MKLLKSAYVVGCIAWMALFAGCHAKETGMNELPEISADIKKQLAFTCTYEKDRIPARDAEADELYKYARWLRKNNILKNDPAVYPAMERLLRIATAYGHDKANIELRNMLEKGQAVSPDPVNDVIDLTQDLIKRGIPAGYYDMGWYLAHGYGVKADQDLAFKYYRKSADMGNPDGQYLVGDMLSDQSKNGTEIARIGWAMYQCSAEQRYAKAASEYGVYLQQNGHSAEALKYLQISTEAGQSSAALRLSKGFSEEFSQDDIFGLGQQADTEREIRYRRIWQFLSDYSYLYPTISELDEIVPLPPAKLPAWNGKFQWLEVHKANVPPPLPSEERIVEMAKAKRLDPKTGRPAR